MIEPIFNIKSEQETANFGKFIIEPLEEGFGQTLGNSLRRVLLAGLPGAAITQIKINGVKHKFSTLEGMSQDIIDLILNLKQVRFKYDGEKPVKLELEKTGPGQIKAGDIKTSAVIEVVNKDLVLADLADKKSKLKLEMVVEKGFGYLPAETKKSEKLGVMSVDAAFSPVKRVNYQVESTRVGQRTDLDKLILEITTDGTIKPKEALKASAKILIAFFNQVIQPKKVSLKEEVKPQAYEEATKLTLEELDLPTRIVNALRKTGYGTVADLLAINPDNLARIKNLGEKSIKTVQAALAKKNIKWEPGEKK
ncbi:MAG: DNA-directed RNA polymerase subunit alpha [Candidatus Shapirobacteria bacterium]|nr:DNA-directed RNA polymerase subunit alpha [Candidatus Shapirobacteria bacterium]